MATAVHHGIHARSAGLSGRSAPRTASRLAVGDRRQAVCIPRAISPAILADVAPQVASTASEVANQANQIVPGSVSAPAWVIPVAALVVTLGGAASAYLLKPGTDAAEQVFARDAKRLGKKAKNTASKAGSKAKQVTKKGRR